MTNTLPEGYYDKAPERLTLQPNGQWIGESGKLYALTYQIPAGRSVWHEVEPQQGRDDAP
jgi:hypothetical protein